MTKLAKKTWTCSIGHGCKREVENTAASVDRYRKFSSVSSRTDMGVARKVTPPPQEMAKSAADSVKEEEEERKRKEEEERKRKEEEEKAIEKEKKIQEEEANRTKEKEEKEKKMDALKKRLVRFYQVYKPSQIPRVPDIALKYLDRSEELIEALQKKYGPEPKEEEEKEEEEIKQEPKEKEKEDTQLAALRARLVRFYKKYNPSQVERVNDIAIKYRDREDDLFKALIEKYGPEGEDDDDEEEEGQDNEEEQQQQEEERQDTELEARLRRFYNKYNPDQISRVSEIAVKYKDRVDALFEALVKKYVPFLGFEI